METTKTNLSFLADFATKYTLDVRSDKVNFVKYEWEIAS